VPTKTSNRRAWCAVVALVLVAGCGGGSGSDEPAAPAKASASASATPTTPAPTTPTAGERPADDRSDAGAIEFAEFVVRRIVGVTSGADVDDVLTLASPDCKGCISLAKRVEKEGTVRQEFDAAPVVTDAKVIDTSDDGTQYLVEQTVELSTGRRVDTATGETVETFEEPTRLSMRVLMTWTDDRWILSNYSSDSAS
jgi:hypothetical protein